MDLAHLNKDVLMNNASYWINQSIESHGAFIVLIVMGMSLIHILRLYWRSVVAGTTGREDGQWQMYFVKALFLQVDRKSKIETMEIFYI